MADATVIDKLIVSLGLDPKEFQKGEKAAAASVVDLEKKVTGSTKSMGSSLASFSLKLLGVATLVAAAKKAITFTSELSESTRKLGIESKNLGLSAAGLRNYQNAVELIGGEAEAAGKTIGNFNKAIFDLTYQGQMGDSLVMLARLGVQFQKADGSARDFKDVILDVADAIQKSGMDRPTAYNYAKSLGFDEGTTQLVLGGRAGIEGAYAESEKRRQVQDKDVAAATRWERSAIRRSQAGQAAGIGGLDSFVTEGFIKANDFATASFDALGGSTQGLKDAATGASKAVHGLADKLEILAKRAERYSRRQNTVGLRNNNPGNLKAVGNQPRDRMGFRVFGSMEEGISAYKDQLERYSSRGINTIEKIVNTASPSKDGNDVEAYIKYMEKETGIKRNEVINSGDYATYMGAMFRFESGQDAPSIDDVADVLTYQNDAEENVKPTPSAQAAASNVTNVDIGSMTVNTRATNADGIASDMGASIKRKLMASHAERGAQ